MQKAVFGYSTVIGGKSRLKLMKLFDSAMTESLTINKYSPIPHIMLHCRGVFSCQSPFSVSNLSVNYKARSPSTSHRRGQKWAQRGKATDVIKMDIAFLLSGEAGVEVQRCSATVRLRNARSTDRKTDDNIAPAVACADCRPQLFRRAIQPCPAQPRKPERRRIHA